MTAMSLPFLGRHSSQSIAQQILNVFGLIIGHWFFVFSRDSIFRKRINPNKKAVFITGCDSGFGFQLAKRLDSKGYHVFAGCLFPTSGGAAELKSSCSSRFCAIHIDVTQDDSVRNAKEFVQKNLGDCELWAVVNNAGVYKGFAVEFTPISDFEDILQVNTLGQVRVTKAFLSLLRQSKGRIINVNSVAGRTAIPHLTCYAMSKFGAVAFTECLRREMDPCGVKVISIEPELFRTPMSNIENLTKELVKTRASMENEFKSSSGKKLIKQMKFLHMCIGKLASPNTHHVVNAMEAAVSMQHPCPVYVPSGNKLRQIFIYFIECLPDLFYDFVFKIYNKAAPVLEPLVSAFL
ncbi:17-beta-hydroxysteroid dehydrogenase type 6-like isoform X2 [Argiope bruennichi]|uniref:17-beta-hydroxysteroid dehydrogenase type 6-like isoform X2 n=1 Tax=Argiope bruennichi TaxID=94029 RepID=UPI0024944397|nr:17-beta-hydroxysteroid dehydrogenase type 6-like isoform X2 [Argiope bruennichi]